MNTLRDARVQSTLWSPITIYKLMFNWYIAFLFFDTTWVSIMRIVCMIWVLEDILVFFIVDTIWLHVSLGIYNDGLPWRIISDKDTKLHK
jgi:hypothetical protein